MNKKLIIIIGVIILIGVGRLFYSRYSTSQSQTLLENQSQQSTTTQNPQSSKITTKPSTGSTVQNPQVFPNPTTSHPQQPTGSTQQLSSALSDALKNAEPTFNITSVPTTVRAGDLFTVAVTINIKGTTGLVTQYISMLYGPASVSNPKSVNDYPISSVPICDKSLTRLSVGCSISPPLANFSNQVAIAKAGTYHFRMHAFFYGTDVWSDEKTITVTAPQGPVNNISLLASGRIAVLTDNNQAVSSVSAGGGTLALTFSVPTSSAFSVDFRGCGQNVGVNAGTSGTIVITPKTSCMITAYKHVFVAPRAEQPTMFGFQVMP